MYSKEYVRFITDFQNEHCPKSCVTVHLLKTHTNHLFNTADAKCPSFEVFHSNLKQNLKKVLEEVQFALSNNFFMDAPEK